MPGYGNRGMRRYRFTDKRLSCIFVVRYQRNPLSRCCGISDLGYCSVSDVSQRDIRVLPQSVFAGVPQGAARQMDVEFIRTALWFASALHAPT